MYKNEVKQYHKFISLVVLALVFMDILLAQHRGDDLAFQGIANTNEVGIQAIGMGGAYTAMSGDINSIFYNAAGLADIDKIQVNLAVNNFSRELWENQDYRPNRLNVTLPFYLEGLYIPDPANDGILDSKIALDSNYVVQHPELGNEPTSEEAADWKKNNSLAAFNNISIAVPFSFKDHKFTLAGSYYRKNNLNDFDRNDTYLDPHIGTKIYDGLVPQQDGTDTLNVNWYRFLRSREGQIHTFKLSLAYQLNKNLQIGLAANINRGNSDDIQSLNKVGYFGLIDENEFFFMHDTLNTTTKGKSDFSSNSFEIGVIYKFERFNIGLKINTPYTVTRTWDYATTIQDTTGITSFNTSGEDEIDIPATYNLGISIRPIDQFIFSMDYEYAPYSKTKFKMAGADSSNSSWADRKALRFGVQYIATDYITFLAGYKSVPEVFVPDGSAYKNEGPKNNSFSIGATIDLLKYGALSAVFVMSELKYYDSYYSNTNYVTQKSNNLLVGYTYKF